MVEANPSGGGNSGRDVWQEQRDKAGKKRKHQKAFGKAGRMNWSEKREKKRQKQQERQNGVDPYEISQYTIGSDRFNEYYKRIFVDVMPTEEEFGTFLQTLYDKLPVTFRINSGEAGFERLSQMLKDPDFIKQFIESAEQEAGDEN